MAHVEVRYYKNYPLEVREFGDTGWAIHVYGPRADNRPKKVAIVTTNNIDGLDDLLRSAHAAVDLDLAGQ